MQDSDCTSALAAPFAGIVSAFIEILIAIAATGRRAERVWKAWRCEVWACLRHKSGEMIIRSAPSGYGWYASHVVERIALLLWHESPASSCFMPHIHHTPPTSSFWAITWTVC